MTSILVTGASGFVGSRLVLALEPAHNVIALSRSETAGGHRHVRGSFLSPEVLAECTATPVDTVVHLAAEIGGCSEEDGLSVNVLGTRRLIRHAVDAGVRRFVLASSIAAPIGLSPDTLPSQLPIPDDYPCEAADAYGLSKALMEEVAFYFHRIEPELDITLFRIGVVLKEAAPPASKETLEAIRIPFISLSTIAIDDAVRAFVMAVERPHRPGVHRMNLMAPWSRTPIPVPETLSFLLGDRTRHLDISHYRVPGNEYASLFTTDRALQELGFTAAVDPRTMSANPKGVHP